MQSESSAGCAIDGCGRAHKARGWCETHYMRWVRHGDPTANLKVRKPCRIEGCDKLAHGHRLCAMHYRRWKIHGDPLLGARTSQGWLDPAGYRMIQVGSTEVREHRHVMALHLGRALLPGETVHHRNGVRHENGIANLELRVGAHPQGLAIDEAIAWAREILRRYT